MAVGMTSYGYPAVFDEAGELVEGALDSAVWAKYLPQAAGSRFSVLEPGDWKVTAQVGLDRGIRIAAGTGVGDAIMDVLPVYDTFSLPAVASSRWVLVVARRSWAAPYTTVFAFIEGTAAKQIPAWTDNPGFESDQPVALVWVSTTSTVVGEIVDLRVWSGPGGVEAAHDLARSYLGTPGAALKIGSTLWRYELQANDVWDWARGAPHLELTTTQGTNQAGVKFGPGTAEKMSAGIDKGRSNSWDRFTIGPADRITVNESGLYSISWLIYGMGGASGSITLRAGDSTVNHASLPFTAVGDMSIGLPNIYLVAGDVIGFYFITTSPVPSGHRIRFTKVR